MKILYLSIILVSISLLLIIFLHPIQAQSIPLDQKNATLTLNFTSEFYGYEGGSVAFSHNNDMFVYPAILKNPKFGNWTSQLWLHYLKNDTSKFIGFNGSLSNGFYESFIVEPRFSSDDKKLLFIGGNCDRNQSHTTFYIIDLQNPRLHCNNLTNVASADWMPDGSIILAQNNEKNDTISIYHNGTEKLLYAKPITLPYRSLNSSHITSIKASHDGTKIALWYSVLLYHETQILDVNQGKIIDTFAGGHPRWSQDDKMLLYSMPTNAGYYNNGPLKSRTYVNLMDVNSNKTTNIDTVNMGIDDLALSLDSKTVFYVMKIPYPYDFLNFTSGIYKIELNHDVDSQSTLTRIETPLQQFKSGIALKDIKCVPDFQLVIKAKSHSPACVKPDDVSKLVERGWADKPHSLQEEIDFANVCLGMNDACRHRYDVKSNDPFGITALIIYHPPDVCLNLVPPSNNVTMHGCPPNTFYLKINSASPTYLKGYNICDGDSCTKTNDISVLLPIKDALTPNFQMIGLPVDLKWKYGDTMEIQLYASPTNDNKTASLVDMGNSTIVP